ncbi:hypothetical protein RE6C_03717 [Rhodopirellula europaea 6C]|uniref:Uncharacterized protein n=1 Tax=Rhodopirellula europaea 6C TaxID=1263867 RepID=M2B1I3_9BACT|nr:hypothetical protein RE6C_03717 [Rhodopirellula europaea 6C]
MVGSTRSQYLLAYRPRIEFFFALGIVPFPITSNRINQDQVFQACYR